MQTTVLFRQLQTAIADRLPIAKHEARALFRRRRISYAVLAATLAGAVLYVGTAGRPLVTQTQAGSTNATQSDNGGTPMQEPDSNQTGDSEQSSTDQQSDSTSNGSSAQSQTSVTVNGQSLAVPENGAMHTTIPNANGQTSVDISHTSSGNNSTSIHVDVNSTSGGGDSDSP